MALYLGGSEKLKISLSDAIYCLNLFSETPITNGIRLLSADGYTLKDSDRLYLTATPGSIRLVSTDGYTLKDSNGLYVTTKLIDSNGLYLTTKEDE